MEYLIFILEGRIPDWHPRRDFSGSLAGGIPELGQIDNGTFHTRAKIQILCFTLLESWDITSSAVFQIDTSIDHQVF